MTYYKYEGNESSSHTAVPWYYSETAIRSARTNVIVCSFGEHSPTAQDLALMCAAPELLISLEYLIVQYDGISSLVPGGANKNCLLYAEQAVRRAKGFL